MRCITLIISFLFVSTAMSVAQTGDTRNFGRLNITQTPQVYDSLLLMLTETNAKQSYENFVNEFINFDPESVDLSGALDDATYEKRLKMMATEIQLPYNRVVKSYINVYTRKDFMERLLGLAQYYFPIFEMALYRHGLPMELKMLPVIESALIPKAVSSAACVGLWQFYPPTGKYYGLEFNSFVDERSDPVKSTEAACRYLKDLYRMYGDWTLVIAAYNCGPGTVNKAIRRVPNAQTYWDIYDYLPRETRNYVPSFIAATYAYTYHKAHDLEPTPIQYPIATDTLKVNRMIHFDQIATTIDVPIDVLRNLNPQYRLDIIPATATTYTLRLPQNKISEYLSRESEIMAKDTLYLGKYLNVSNLDVTVNSAGRQSSSKSSIGSTSGTQVTYKIKSGDNLGSIAKRYGVTVKQIQGWNKLSSTNIKPNQLLKIYRK